MSWLDDAIAYPWTNPQARDLHRKLMDAFRQPADVRMLVQAAGRPDASRIAFGQSIHQIWVDTLDRASAEGALRALLTYVVSQGSVASPVVAFVAALLADGAPLTR